MRPDAALHIPVGAVKVANRQPDHLCRDRSAKLFVLVKDHIVHTAAFSNAGVLDDCSFHAVVGDELLQLVCLRIILCLELQSACNTLEQIGVVQAALSR